ncbi:CRISPR-associated endoribonuclease Cas6 [Hazenella coriacea]|uniref:CRISPR-associated Cas6 family protein n=1 Tax=Hazenella coriacea TaxID=1179467 RepID=A0A4R3L303_9BACL|nr:CRISPR-associated endoribonuclease Cas6 [Hazenella coriacea]TCS93602.1 CRISPR-associated Cas6 family protein [Hazenella coriacea]
MRVQCTLHCKELPITYHMLFVSLIKKCLETSDQEYYQKLYYYDGKKNKQSKNFTFAVFLKDYQLEGDSFEIRGQVDLFVSSPDPEWMIHFYNGLLRQKDFQYQGIQLAKGRVRVLNEKTTFDDPFMVCQTLSPLYIKDRENRPVSPSDPTFQHELNYITNLNLKNYRGFGLRSELSLTPLDMKKVVVKDAIHQQQEEKQRSYLFLEGYKGKFLLQGHPEDLQTLYQLGIGFRRSSGWGMIEVIQP